MKKEEYSKEVLIIFVITHLSNLNGKNQAVLDVLTPFVITHLSNQHLLSKLAAFVLTPFVITHLSNLRSGVVRAMVF